MNLAKKIVSIVIGTSLLLPAAISLADDPKWEGKTPKYTEAKVTTVAGGSTLLFSDSPEMVKECGVLYRDTVEGKVRLFFHHVNNTRATQKLAIVLQNKYPLHPAIVTVGRQGVSRPNSGWLKAGKEAQLKYFEEAKSRTFKLRGKKELLTGVKGLDFEPMDLISGIVDFDFTNPVIVSVMMLPENTDFYDAVDVYPVLPPDPGENALRGTFPTDRLNITMQGEFNTSGKDIWGVKLADNDSYIHGIDATTGKKVVNFGNYGVIYDFSFKTKGRKAAQVRFNAYGGSYGGACYFDNGDKNSFIHLPRHVTGFGKTDHNANVILGNIQGGKDGKVVFSPPGSSNLPIRIFFEPVPKKIEKE